MFAHNNKLFADALAAKKGKKWYLYVLPIKIHLNFTLNL